MQKLNSVSSGDLLIVREWECEGVEHPWGFHMEVLDGRSDISGALFRALTRRSKTRVKLEVGEVCVALRVHAREHPAIDEFCEVLVRGMKLGVHARFLHSHS